MPTRRANPRKWLAIAMIALGVIIVVASLSIGRSGYYPHGMYGMYGAGGYGPGMYGMYGAGRYGPGMYSPGMYAHPYRQYGDHMAGNGPMWGGWVGAYGMPYPGAMMFDGNPMPGLVMMRGLDLKQDQQARIDAIESQAGEKRRNLIESLNAENGKLNALLLGESIDTGALTEQYARCAQLRRQLFELGLDERQRIDAVLNDEQRRQWRRWQRDYAAQ